MTGPVRRIAASALAWIVGAVAAVAVGVLALSMIGADLTSRTAQPLSPDTVAREASDASAAPAGSASTDSAPSASAALVPAPATSSRPGHATPAASASPGPTGVAADVDRVVSSPGGSAVARCAGGRVYLLSWSPEQGYRTDDVVRGPAAVARVRFESGADTVLLTVRCGNDGPQATVTRRGDGHDGD